MPSARIAAMLLLTLRGTPTLYYGDEIGMRDDPVERNVPGLGLGRDPERTPMQWSAEPHAGFSDHEPWLPVAPDYRDVNVAVERDATNSMLRLYAELIALRRGEPALDLGAESRALAFTGSGIVALSTHLDRRLEPVAAEVGLRPHEGVIVRLTRA